MADTSYLIKARPPVRAFLIAALLALVGAVGLVLSLVYSWGWILVTIGSVLLALGVILCIVAMVATKRQAVTLILSKKGYQLHSSQGLQKGNWKAVTRVSQTVDGSIITIHERDEVRHHLVFTPGAMGEVDELIADITQRLDEAKGYTNF